jgi:hypothetical protein
MCFRLLGRRSHLSVLEIRGWLASACREGQARVIADRLARLGALAAFIEAKGRLAEAYVATRLFGPPHATYGACEGVQSLLLSRVLPPSLS